jgi:galactarate dehydratase
MKTEKAAPPYIRVHRDDNVAIVVDPDGLRAGTQLPDGLTLRDSIPQAHKIALSEVGVGEPVVRYGHTIALAKRSIPAGSWIREDVLDVPPPPPLDELPLATATPSSQPALTGYTFEGFRNADGSVGTKNILGITTTVQCVAPTVDYAVRRIKSELLPRFPNVDDAVAITHTYGCGVALEAPGAEIPVRTLRHIGTHPNLGAAPLIVSLGCEKLQPDRLFPSQDLGRLPVLESDPLVIRMQDERGFAEVVAAILRAAEKRLEHLNRRRREPVPAAELVVGLQCGGSDAFSGVTCNPAVGFAADLLVRAGATVMFSEVTEVRDAVHLLTPRAASRQVALDLIREMRWYDEYLARGATDRTANPTPGNKRGGVGQCSGKSTRFRR